MRSKKSFQSGKILFLLLTFGILCALQNRAIACGPFFESESRIYLFKSSWEGVGRRDMEKAENLALWQKLTDAGVSISDIEQAVYHDSLKDLYVNRVAPYTNGNSFYIHLYESRDSVIGSFLCVAKQLQERREAFASPWYYPETEGDFFSTKDETGDFDETIRLCRENLNSILRDRYGLQLVRALFSSRRYAQCIEAYEDVYATTPDDNLFKRMSEAYVAGCWSRLGEVDKANEYFAQAGDFHSLKTDDPISFMAERNPDSPELMEYIQSCMSDSANMADIESVAKQVVASMNPKNRGDWEFLLAYIAGEYHRDNAMAARKINAALNQRFSTDDLRDHARAYRMKLDARQGIRVRLLDDLRWFETKAKSGDDGLNEEWNEILCNIVRTNWVPALWKNGDYATAILLCGFMDNLRNINGFNTYDAISGSHYWPTTKVGIREMRESKRYFNQLDYCSLAFNLMETLTAAQLAHVKSRIDCSSDPLYAFLKKYARTDSDYFNELIGTLALREEDYTLAVRYLSMVGKGYDETLNVYKEGYLKRNPFFVYPSRWQSKEWLGIKNEYFFEDQTDKAYLPGRSNAKLNFARQMQLYKRRITVAPDADGRAMAQLMYAIGRRNSFEECWALTQYYRGFYNNSEYVEYTEEYDNPYYEEGSVKYDFLYDYVLTTGPEHTEKIYRRDVERALAAFDSDEARARAEYMMGNLKTVIKHFGDTDMADFVKTTCDRWKQWL